MTETNDLLEKIELGLNELPTRAMDDIKAYGKAEFERGYKTACTEKRFESDTHFYDLRDENKTLKDKNKELMRENVELRNAIEATHKGMITNIDRIIELQTEVDSLKARRWAETDRAFKEGYEKGRAQEESEEPEWYDAEKCLPLPDSKVIIEVEHCLISDTYIKKWRYADENT